MAETLKMMRVDGYLSVKGSVLKSANDVVAFVKSRGHNLNDRLTLVGESGMIELGFKGEAGYATVMHLDRIKEILQEGNPDDIVWLLDEIVKSIHSANKTVLKGREILGEYVPVNTTIREYCYSTIRSGIEGLERKVIEMGIAPDQLLCFAEWDNVKKIEKALEALIEERRVMSRTSDFAEVEVNCLI